MSCVVILMYHIVAKSHTSQERPYACSPRLFSRHMQYLSSQGFQLISLDEISRYIKNREHFPPNSIAVTIDDGFRETYENAFPLLQHYGIPATVFVITGLTGKSNLWMQTRGFPSREMLSWRHIKDMRVAGITFGSHTVTHPRLPDISDNEAHHEIRDSKKVLEDRLGEQIAHFAYPFGLFTERTRALVEEAGYVLACSCRSGFNRSDVDPLVLRRIDVYGTDSLRKFAQKITFGTNDAGLLLPARYYWRRLRERLAGRAAWK